MFLTICCSPLSLSLRTISVRHCKSVLSIYVLFITTELVCVAAKLCFPDIKICISFVRSVGTDSSAPPLHLTQSVITVDQDCAMK